MAHGQLINVQSSSFLASSLSSPSLCAEGLGLLRASLAEDLNVVDEPVRFLEVAGVGSDVFLTSGRLGGAGGVVAPDLTGPDAAEGGVENDVVVHEVGIDIAAAARERGGGVSPGAGIGVSGVNISGDAATREEEHLDGVGGPLHSGDTTANGVESITKILGVSSLGTAPLGTIAG